MWLWPFARARLLRNPAKLGQWGETRACRFLVKLGYKTLARNWRAEQGELDLVMADGRAIVFVEVKSRRDEDFTPAVRAITTHKKTLLYRTAKCFLRQYHLSDRPLRFDVVTVVLGRTGSPQIRHYRNAFVP